MNPHHTILRTCAVCGATNVYKTLTYEGVRTTVCRRQVATVIAMYERESFPAPSRDQVTEWADKRIGRL